MKNVLHLLLGVNAVTAALDQHPLKKHAKPNIVFILTDDQDLHMNSLDYMPLLQKYLVQEGTTYKRHYCSTAICCPSRVTLWTGKNAHNTNVTDVFPPYGGYPKFVSQGLNENYLPVWLREAGYNTYYTGKLFNAHTVDNYDSPYPAGWTASDFLLDPYTYQYLNATTQRNKDKPVNWQGHYSTDVLAEKAYGLLDEAIEAEEPFFLTIATNAPHSNVGTFDATNIVHRTIHPNGIHSIAGLVTAPIPAQRHKNLFLDVKIPRTANFNPGVPSGASWVKALPRLNDTVIEYNDLFYVRRLQALQAVDEIIEGVFQRLEEAGILDNTYVVYSTDNGYHISQHRMHPGKECGFEEDINIPLIVRGPGVPVGEVAEVVTAHTDLAPTFLKIIGAELRPDFDGTPIPLTKKELVRAGKTRQEHVNVEFWGLGIPEGEYAFSVDEGKVVGFGPNNTYKALRIIGNDYNLYYSVWCTNEHELYDLTTDPYQVNNIYPKSLSAQSDYRILGQSLSRLIQRLDALLLVTKSCRAETCVRPWEVLHPNGQVQSLEHALNTKFDAFYAYVKEQVAFDRCELGYLIDAEGPQKAPVFGKDYLP